MSIIADERVVNAAATDLDARTITPTQELIDSNACLDDPAKIAESYDRQGYLLFRSVLDLASIDNALRAMMKVMGRHGIVAADAVEPLWTGAPLTGSHEESPEFSGICRRIIEHPANSAVFEKILGEKTCQVPIVQYRSYPPGHPVSMVHQDGFQSPGIDRYRPVWIPLMKIGREEGGLTLALGVHRRGLVHNLAKPPMFPVASTAIPADAWATTTFHPGDVLVVHPHTPHVGLANRSDRVRFSIDTRVQSATSPTVLLGDVVALEPRAMTIRQPDGAERRIEVDEDTFIRTTENAGRRVPLAQFIEVTPIGLRVVTAVNDGVAKMVRRASEG